jgi:hypothetical protein
MSEASYSDIAERYAKVLITQACWPLGAVAVIAVAMQVIDALAAQPAAGTLHLVAVIACCLAALATVALSAILLFDALLFRVIASSNDEMSGTAAVDDMLARMRLKAPPLRNRTLAERIAGTKRLLLKQRCAFALFLVAVVVALATQG